MHPCPLACVRAYPCQRVCSSWLFSLFPACGPALHTAVLHNETPSAALFFMAMSMCCDANEPSLPKTPPLIVLFDLPLILLIRSPTFKLKRFVSTSKSARSHECMCVCTRENKIKWHKEKEIVILFHHLFLCELGPSNVW